MARTPSSDIDDDFNEIYKEYTGPPVSNATSVQDKTKGNKRPQVSSDEEEEPRDPNAVPTDFTSREAKVWEAKSKATERNWKKRKEEEMICKICGESGHFTQGCPSTLGANRKSQDFFERVPAREKHVKALFTEKVIQKIEKDIGCKIKMEEKFIIVSGKDRLCLAKGVDAVHKVIKEEGNKNGSSSSHRTRSRSPEKSPVGLRVGRSELHRSLSSPRNGSGFQRKFGRQEKVVEDRLREDLKQVSRGSPQAYGSDGARGRPSRSKSPARPAFASSVYNSYNDRNQSIGAQKGDGWDAEGHGPDMHSGLKFDHPGYPQTLEELELEYKREAMELGRIRDKEEDEENYKHREAIRELRENYMKKLVIQRGMHAKQWEEFLEFDVQRRQRARQHMSASGFGSYNHPGYSDYDRPSGNLSYTGANIPIDSRGRYPYPLENYPTRPHDTYGEFQRQRHEDFGKAYNRY
ncbi:PREDICTED: uncharacterized protein LOC104605029 isoform X2 [Nelumbo nucifera]|uniref:Uncharacterized protein LOC104605029 isoform X2 n=1 Tax=Nelumbo nucifera TaxID=4432 RepID=A0A1U8AXY7_NELNU|nr:PREDICTED: uncharacterized protein LOC104605029 isoform X2 [Nelumbo nucifera]